MTEWTNYNSNGTTKSGNLIEELDSINLSRFTFGEWREAKRLRRDAERGHGFGPTQPDVEALDIFLMRFRA